MVIVASSLWRRTQPGAEDSRIPWRVSRHEMGSLEKLAKTSIAQGSALSQERDARQRTEQNLALNQRLLNQALEEKIHLGRDLWGQQLSTVQRGLQRLRHPIDRYHSRLNLRPF